jgi:hypothetical protein
VGGSQRPLDSLRIDRLGDLAGYNGDGGTLSVFQNPGVPNIVSEYGSTTADRPGKYEPGWGDLARDSGRAKYAWRSGQAIWCGFDHGSIAGSALGKMGIVDYFRIPKRAYYWYRNEYAKVAPPQWPQPGTPAALRLEADKTFAATDGTDDIKLLVTVLDAKGKPISNNPDVTLKILSGPGEFPTGPSISFSEKSDIRILDGQAAIELRSFWSGKCAVQATSPGLAPATVSLTFTGPYAYVKGVTPQSPVRPHTRFTRKQTKVTQSFGRNNPTFASSALEAHPAGLAADGENNTWWQPAAGDHHPCWTLDTEKNLAVSGINISFPQSKAYRYVVQVSSDHQHWTTVADNSTNTKTEDKRQIQLNGVEGSIIRICFEDNSPAALAEVEVLGTVLE